MKNNNEKVVWLCDLTHSYQMVAMSKMPLAIGFIAAYCVKNLKPDVTFKLMKFYGELQTEIKSENSPFLIGFSNYT